MMTGIAACLTVMRLALQNVRAEEIAAFALPAVVAAFTRAPLRSFLPLIVLPAIWVLLAIWAGIFWAPHIIADPPLWRTLPVTSAYPLFLACTLYLVWRLPDLRVVTVAFAFSNLSFVTRVLFVAGMAVTGIWL